MGAGNGGVGTILRVQSKCTIAVPLLNTRPARRTSGRLPAGKAAFSSLFSVSLTHLDILIHPLPALPFSPFNLFHTFLPHRVFLNKTH